MISLVTKHLTPIGLLQASMSDAVGVSVFAALRSSVFVGAS